MSMALVLEHTAEFLRKYNGWTYEQCGVQYDAVPMLQNAGQFYIAVDDAGVETGNDSTDSLKEVMSITVGVWRRSEHLSQRDRRGNLKLPFDKYLAGAYTLHDLERTIIVPRLNGLHANYTYVNELNTRYNLPDPDAGPVFHLCFMYKGRGRIETYGVDDANTIQTWYGYRLRFRGLTREQRLRHSTQAQG